ATEYGYGSKIEKPADPVKESTETTAYEFIGWYYLGKEWNFDTDIVNYNINLQSKWNEIAIEVEKPDDTQSDSELDSDIDSEQNSSNNDTAKPGASDLLAGCSGVVGGVASGLTALGVVAYVLLKKKED
ncbi:MAG: InlB B-repeat-containing protein, partial [Clostridia bacterium]|nr:InlB B-repeat-containing protein [Clostridia bacterium]